MSQFSTETSLQVLPTRIFKSAPDFNPEGVEGWAFMVGVESSSPIELTCHELTVTLLQAGQEIETMHYPALALTTLGFYAPSRLSPLRPSTHYWPWVTRLHFMRPMRLQIDALKLELTMYDALKQRTQLELTVPVESYQQKTEIAFPFQGTGLITQGGILNQGHRNRSGQFAIDALGLTDNYAPQTKASSTPDAYVGWGRPILAPAAGTIVFARGDRPDQPVTDVSDPEFYAPEHPEGGDPGNYVVIQHTSDEFSMIAHLRQYSLAVAVGQIVGQGDLLGVIGNSGDSTGPHLHHQLQSGPNWQTSDALPHVYRNGPGTHHDRGWYFLAE